MPFVHLASGLYTSGQFPLDNKLYVNTLSELADLGASNHKAFYYYEDLEVYCLETKRSYTWRETTVSDLPTDGTLPMNYIYPIGAASNGVVYGGRSFNFYPYKIKIEELPQEVIDLITATTEGNRLITGSIDWLQGRTFFASADYILEGQIHTGVSAEISLNAAGVDYPRFDAVIVDANEVISVITGEEAPNPPRPIIDNDHILITYIYVPEQSNDVGFSEKLVYNENLGEPVEWSVITTNGFILNDTNDPLSGAFNIKGETLATTDKLRFTTLDPLLTAGVVSMSFYVKAHTSNIMLRILFNREGVRVSSDSIFVTAGQFNFDANAIGTWQLITIPVASLQLGLIDYDEIVIENTLLNSSVDIDRIRMVYGETDVVVPADINVYGHNDTIEFPVNGRIAFENITIVPGEQKIVGRPVLKLNDNYFFLSKHPDNNDSSMYGTLQANDFVVEGFWSSEEYWPRAQYLGGDILDEDNFNAFSPIIFNNQQQG